MTSRMGVPETIEDFARRKGLTVAQLEQAARNRRTENRKTPARENMALAAEKIYWRPLRSIARYTRRLIHNLGSTTDEGLSIEKQVRKEWDPKKGGLPIF